MRSSAFPRWSTGLVTVLILSLSGGSSHAAGGSKGFIKTTMPLFQITVAPGGVQLFH